MASLEELQARVEKGDAQAQLELGLALEKSGWPTQEIYAQSASWFRKAAEQGLAEAQYKLGLACHFGLGVEKNGAAAVEWLRKAADQNHHSAASQLGWMFLNGDNVEKNAVEGINWLRKVADQGDSPTQCNLGTLYADGRLAPKDEKQAVQWLRKAAEQGHKAAQYALGGMYAEGRGADKDETEALRWIQKAAEQGYFAARQTLRRWPPRPVQPNPKIAATKHVEDLAAIIKANPQALMILGISTVVTRSLLIALQVEVKRRQAGGGFGRPEMCEIFCFHAADYSIRPTNPAIMMGGPTIELHEKHSLLENPTLQLIPGGDGEIFRPPVNLKLLVLDQSYVIAERFELRTPISPPPPAKA